MPLIVVLYSGGGYPSLKLRLTMDSVTHKFPDGNFVRPSPSLRLEESETASSRGLGTAAFESQRD